MKVIVSTNGYGLQLSDEDFEYLNQWNWFVIILNGKPNAVTRLLSNRTNQSMSHDILKFRGIHFKDEVDHKDRNVLNNQFTNLRPATRSQNCSNRGLFCNSTTGYIGVSYNKSSDKYQARITLKGLEMFLGRFSDPEVAAKVRDVAAKKFHGDFASLNFPEST